MTEGRRRKWKEKIDTDTQREENIPFGDLKRDKEFLLSCRIDRSNHIVQK